MTNLTITINEELKQEIQKHKEVNWSAVARNAMEEHLKNIELMNKLTSKSKLTEKDAIEIGRKINKAVARKHGLL